MKRKKFQHFLCLILLTFCIGYPLRAELIGNPSLGYTLDLPEGFRLVNSRENARYVYQNTIIPVGLQVALYPYQQFGTVAAAADHIFSQLKAQKKAIQFLMQGNPAIALRLLKTFVHRIYTQKRRFMILTIEDKPTRIADVFLMLDETVAGLDRSTDARTFEITIDEVARWAGLSKPDTEDGIRKFIDQGRISVYDDRITVQNMTDLMRYVNTRRSKEHYLMV